jgi:hypothetical protein
MALVSDDKNRYFADIISLIKQNLVECDKWMSTLKISLEEFDYSTSKLAGNKCRQKLISTLQQLDKLTVSVCSEERVEVFGGFRPLTLGQESSDVAKSDTQDDLIRTILEDKRNVGKVMARLKPSAKNE